MAAATVDPVMPVRILLAGQVSAGKSSLLNALAQEVRGAVGPVPTTSNASEFLLDQDGWPSVMLSSTCPASTAPQRSDRGADAAGRARRPRVVGRGRGPRPRAQ
jgi:hypothetical protein